MFAKHFGGKTMANRQPEQRYEIGMVGLGVMGRNFPLNMADHGHSVAGYDQDATKVAALRHEAENRDIRGAADIKEFIALLPKPCAIMMKVPAGAPVDSVISTPFAAPGCRPISSRPSATILEPTHKGGAMSRARFTQNGRRSKHHDNE
jgi:hypothetical protein